MDIEKIERERIEKFFSICVFTSVPVFTTLSVLNFIEGMKTRLSGSLILFSIFISGYIFSKFIKNKMIIYRAMALSLSLVLLYLMFKAGDKESPTIWVIYFPLMFIYFFGKREGLCWTLVLGIALCVISLHYFYNVSFFDFGFGLRFFIAYSFITIFTWGLESTRVDFKEKLLQESRELSLKNEELKEAKRKLKLSEKERSMLLDKAGDSICILDPDTKSIIEANKEAYTVLGYTKDEFLGMSVNDISCSMNIAQVDIFFNKIKEHKSLRMELIGQDKRGKPLSAEVTATSINLGGREVIHTIARDMTEQKISEKERELLLEEKQKLIDEKELLMKELNHRVANNLTIINSMIGLEMSESGDCSSEILGNIKNRIHAIGMVHRKLYQSENFEEIEIKNFLESLIDDIYKSLLGNENIIRINRNIVSYNFDTKQAVSLGIIVNELIINSVKYAFPNGEGGEISVETEILNFDDSLFYSMRIHDNGAGEYEVPIKAVKQNVGTLVIESFVADLKGTLEFNNDNGYDVNIQFPIS